MNKIKPSRLTHWLSIYKLYRKAFPRYERKPFSLIISMYKKGITDVWYFEKSGHFAGLAFTVNRDNAILLDYLAIAPDRRGEGIGSMILRELGKYYSPKGFFVEIESVYADCENKEERLRRKQFYLKNGMLPMKVMVKLFGVEMELLGMNCMLTYEEYFAFYHEVFGDIAEKHVKELEWQGE